MTIKTIVSSALLIGLVAGCATERREGKETQAELQAQAKVAKADAERIALAKAPGGTVKESELEKEKGKLIYSFDIATPGSPDITEVAVDALTGEVVAVEKESPAEQAKEKAENAKEGKQDKD